MSWLFPNIENTSLTQKEITEYMQPVQDVIGQMQGGYDESVSLSRNLMDPNSAVNLQRRNIMGQQGASQLALQNLLNRRQAAALGQESGITQAQTRQARGQMGRDINQMYQQGLGQQYALGLNQFNTSQGLLGNIMQGQLGVTENITQAEIARRQAQMDIDMAEAANKQQFVTGLLGGVGNIAGDVISGFIPKRT
tara:strand:+ start:39 stop:623 length:585 start_codon:yes stop_codon:yes gene_type:complete